MSPQKFEGVGERCKQFATIDLIDGSKCLPVFWSRFCLVLKFGSILVTQGWHNGSELIGGGRVWIDAHRPCCFGQGASGRQHQSFAEWWLSIYIAIVRDTRTHLITTRAKRQPLSRQHRVISESIFFSRSPKPVDDLIAGVKQKSCPSRHFWRLLITHRMRLRHSAERTAPAVQFVSAQSRGFGWWEEFDAGNANISKVSSVV